MKQNYRRWFSATQFSGLLSLAMMVATAAFVTGCGNSNDNPEAQRSNPGNNFPGNFNPATGTTIMTDGSIQIAFSGANIYSLGAHFLSNTAGFQSASYVPRAGYGNISLASSYSATGNVSIAGESRMYRGVQFRATLSSGYAGGSGYGYGYPTSGSTNMASINGAVFIPSTLLGQYYPSNQFQVIGLAFDLWQSNGTIFGGTVWVETSRDNYGQSHGLMIPF